MKSWKNQGDYIYECQNNGQGFWKRLLSEIIVPLANDVGVKSITEPFADSAYYVDCLNSKIVIPKIALKNYGTSN